MFAWKSDLILLQYVGAQLNKSAWAKVCVGRPPYLPLSSVKNKKQLSIFFYNKV